MKDRRLQGVAFLALGVFSFLVYSRTYEYVLVLQRESSYSFFLFDRHFLADFLQSPGGFMFWAGRFFAQFYEYTWLGALVVSGLIVGFGVLLHGALKRLMGPAALFCALLPCIALATTLNEEVIDIALGLIASAGPFLIYLRLPKGLARRIYALAALPALYLICGGCFWLFALWVTATEWFEEKPSAGVAWKLLIPAVALSLPVIAWRWLFLVPLRSAALDPTIFAQGHPLPAELLYGYLALMPFWAKASRRVRALSAEASKRAVVAAVASLALLAVVSLWFCYDAELGELAEYHQLYKQKRWDDILAKAAGNPSPGLMPQFFTNCALQHQGKLLDEMFRYPQTYGPRGLILNFPVLKDLDKSQDDTDRAMYNSDLFFEMGHVNVAFLHAFDHMMMRGKTYENVSRVMECSMMNRNYGTARKYAALLRRTLFHRELAKRCERLLADEQAMDEYYAKPRERMPTIELPMTLAAFVPPLTLLASNPRNRMAFDYLVAWCLLDEEALPMLPEYLRHLKDAGYASAPIHAQEALMTLLGGPSAVPERFNCDAKVAARFDAFKQEWRRYPTKLAAQEGLLPSFGGTFMYYDQFVGPRDVLNYGTAHMRLGNEFRALGMDEEALAHYRQAVRLYPQSAETHEGLADLLKAMGKLEEADLECRKAQEARQSKSAPPPNLVQQPPQRVE